MSVGGPYPRDCAPMPGAGLAALRGDGRPAGCHGGPWIPAFAGMTTAACSGFP